MPLAGSCNTPPVGYVNLFYTHSLLATGGTPPYTWSITSGTLPLGLVLSLNGSISGTPMSPVILTGRIFSFTAQVMDSLGNTATITCSITIYNYLAGFPCS
jgi:hypothetical protein